MNIEERFFILKDEIITNIRTYVRNHGGLRPLPGQMVTVYDLINYDFFIEEQEQIVGVCDRGCVVEGINVYNYTGVMIFPYEEVSADTLLAILLTIEAIEAT